MGAGGRGHVEILAPAIAALMAAEGLAFSDLSLIAVNVGPGSFSGVRAGCASARALAQAASLPVVGITVMELWAQRAAADWAENCATDDVLLTALPAGANLFMQAFRLHHGAPVAMTAAASHSEAEALSQCREFTSLVLLGGGAETLAAALAKNTASESRPGPSWRVPRLPQPDAILLATLASQREPAADFPIPVYMRPPDARLPLEKPPGE